MKNEDIYERNNCNSSSLQGMLSDSVMTELVLDKLLNRYLLMSLRANLDNNDSVFKAKEVRFYFLSDN